MLKALEGMSQNERARFLHNHVVQTQLPFDGDMGIPYQTSNLELIGGISQWLLFEAPQNVGTISYQNNSDELRKCEIITNIANDSVPDFAVTSELPLGETVFEDLTIQAGEQIAVRLWETGSHLAVDVADGTLTITLT